MVAGLPINLSAMIVSRFRILPLLALAALLFGASASHAQTRWLQTVEVIAPVDDYKVTGVFRDSLIQVMQRGKVELRREPDASVRTYRALEDELYGEGLDFTSANRVFLTYRLEASQRGFTSEIEKIYFIYRPEGFEDVDMPIFYVSGKDPAVRRLILSGGTQMLANEAAFEPFYDQLTFHHLDESTVVSVGGRLIRDPEKAAQERERLLATVRRFIY